jgi:Sulfotransferase domain
MKTAAKVFCIGSNKTGTTSLEAFLKSLGFALGDQAAGELLVHDWAVRNFEPIIALARSAEAHQDIPFSLPFTFIALDQAFPGSKFILSVRNDAEQWYHSLTGYHEMVIGKGRRPTADDLKDCPYRYKGWLFEVMQLIYGVSEQAPYEKSLLITQYENHNRTVAEYFRSRPESLLIVNLEEENAAERIMDFLSLPYAGETMPHLNRST